MQLHVLWLAEDMPPHMLEAVKTLASVISPNVHSCGGKQALHASAAMDPASGRFNVSSGSLHDTSQGIALFDTSDMPAAQKQHLSAFVSQTHSAVKCGRAGDQGRQLANSGTCVWMLHDLQDADKHSCSPAESFAANFDAACLHSIDLVIPVGCGSAKMADNEVADDVLGLLSDDVWPANSSTVHAMHPSSAKANLQMHLLRATAMDAPCMCALQHLMHLFGSATCTFACRSSHTDMSRFPDLLTGPVHACNTQVALQGCLFMRPVKPQCAYVSKRAAVGQ